MEKIVWEMRECYIEDYASILPIDNEGACDDSIRVWAREEDYDLEMYKE